MRKDGTRFWGSVVITTLHDDENNITGFTKVTRDLTERKIAEEKMLGYTLELEAQNKELEQFAYIASHDLQEPLRKIRTFTELLQQNLHDQPAAKRYFEKINSSAHRMTDLIKSVLAYSRISKEGDQFEAVDLNPILKNVLADFELLIEEKKATFHYSVLPTVQGIPGQLSQMFSNLIGNAIKFTTVPPVIHITSTKLGAAEVEQRFDGQKTEQQYCEISISDNGIGFEQQYEKKIFTMFQRLHRKEQYAGTGIGLALCKKIVENHNGLITAKSVPAVGTTFTISLPVVS
jgi:signal transduction histidine kinase